MLEILKNLGAGGTGMQGDGPGTVAAALKELQGLTISVLPAKGAGVKNDLAAIRKEDTIVAAINNNAGALTDVLGTTSIVDVRASGTVTLAGVAAGETVTVAGLIYTAVTGAVKSYSEFSISGNDTEDAASLASAINARESNRTAQVTATSALGVVTVTAVAEGAGGNAIALVDGGAGITISGATLTGGTSTGGISVVGATNQVILVWFNKK